MGGRITATPTCSGPSPGPCVRRRGNAGPEGQERGQGPEVAAQVEVAQETGHGYVAALLAIGAALPAYLGCVLPVPFHTPDDLLEAAPVLLQFEAMPAGQGREAVGQAGNERGRVKQQNVVAPLAERGEQAQARGRRGVAEVWFPRLAELPPQHHHGQGMNRRTSLQAFMDGFQQKEHTGNKVAKKPT